MSALKRAAEVPGGVVDGKPDERYDREQLAKGTGVEMEHTNDTETAKDIAKDHLEENEDLAGQENEAVPYYDALVEQEEMAEAKREGELDNPTPADNRQIADYVANQDDLDDDNLHNLFMSLGVEPNEGEEAIYSLLQQHLQAHPDLVDPAQVGELEQDDEEGQVHPFGENMNDKKSAADHFFGDFDKVAGLWGPKTKSLLKTLGLAGAGAGAGYGLSQMGGRGTAGSSNSDTSSLSSAAGNAWNKTKDVATDVGGWMGNNPWSTAGIGAGLGGGLGALFGGKNRWLMSLLGTLLGGGAGYGASHLLGKKASTLKAADGYSIPWLQPTSKQFDTNNLPNVKIPFTESEGPGGAKSNMSLSLGNVLNSILKNPYPVAGATGGAGLGALIGGKGNRLLGMLLGALAGGAGGYAMGKFRPNDQLLPSAPKSAADKTAVLGRAMRGLSGAGRGIKRLFQRPQVKAPPPRPLPVRRSPARIATPPAQKATMQAAARHMAMRDAQRAAGPMKSQVQRALPWATGVGGASTLGYFLSQLLGGGGGEPQRPPDVVKEPPQPKPQPTAANLRREIR